MLPIVWSVNASSQRESLGEDGDSSNSDPSERTTTRSDEHLSELPSQRDDQDESRGNRSTGDNLQGKIEQELPERSSFSMDLNYSENDIQHIHYLLW